jgi:hypothetical protein
MHLYLKLNPINTKIIDATVNKLKLIEFKENLKGAISLLNF